jgi:hypothetical protein
VEDFSIAARGSFEMTGIAEKSPLERAGFFVARDTISRYDFYQ